MIGERYHKLIIIGEAERRKSNRMCIAKCDCGNVTTTSYYHVKLGHTKSCGCMAKNTQLKSSHGLSREPIYSIWRGILRRTKPNYKDYGARGIRMCEEWRDFVTFKDWAFANGWKQGLHIDRIDNNGNYEPSNCRCVTPMVNNNNRSNSHNLTHPVTGETKTLFEWANQYNLKPGTLWQRLKKINMPLDKALTKPFRKHYETNSPPY